MPPTVREPAWGGLPQAPDRTGGLSVVRQGRPKGRAAFFEEDGGPYRVRPVSSTLGGWRRGTAGDCQGSPRTVREKEKSPGGWGRLGTVEGGRRW